MITSVLCPECKRIFLYTFYTKSCVCGWEPDDEFGKGLEEVGKNKNKKKRNRKFGRKKNMNPTQAAAAAATTYVSPHADSWEVEIDEVHECSKVPKEQKVLIELFAKRKINALMKKYPNIEWLAYLLGDKENDPYTVKDIFIPKQEISATSVDNIVCDEFNTLPIIGVMHSHHGMGNGFSGTDHEWINQNHNISLCISKTGIAGQVRVTTPCGALKIIKSVVRVKYPDIEYDFNGWLEEETKKIKKKTYAAATTYNGGNTWYGGGQGYAGRGWHKGQPGIWQNGVFIPDTNPPTPAGGQRIVPRHGEQPLSESQQQYSTGVAVVPPKKESGVPTINEEMSLAEALTQLTGTTETKVEVATAKAATAEETVDTQLEASEATVVEEAADEWDTGLKEGSE